MEVEYNNSAITSGSKNVMRSGIKSHVSHKVKSTSIYSTEKITPKINSLKDLGERL